MNSEKQSREPKKYRLIGYHAECGNKVINIYFNIAKRKELIKNYGYCKHCDKIIHIKSREISSTFN